MTVERLQPLPRTASVLRLTPRRAAFPETTEQAQWDDFVPSNDEKEDAEKTGDPVLVSVWNEEHTSLEQARALYGREGLAFRLAVGAVEDAVVEDTKPRFRVVTDPYTDDARPGVVGHCGMTGLKRRDREPRPTYRHALGCLAACAGAC